MLTPTHVLAGVASWEGACLWLRPGVGAVAGGLLVAGLAAILPDIDTPRSRAARLLGPVTGVLGWLVATVGGGHRGVTHSVAGAVLWGGLWVWLWHACGWPWWVCAAAVAGWCSHPVLDRVCTGLGIRTGRRAGRRWSGELVLVRPLAAAGVVVLAVLLAAGR